MSILQTPFRLLVMIHFFEASLLAFAQSGTDQQIQRLNLARLEGLRAECLVRYSGDRRFCERKVRQQCREILKNRQCRELMSKLPKSPLPNTHGPGLI